MSCHRNPPTSSQNFSAVSRSMPLTEKRSGTVLALLLALLAASASQAQQAPPAAPPAAGLPAVPAPPVASVQPRFVIVLDPAHGGTETGARLSDRLLEKDIVLTLAVRLRSTLAARGLSVVSTRESDSLLPAVNRAESANHAGAAACISIHATATG